MRVDADTIRMFCDDFWFLYVLEIERLARADPHNESSALDLMKCRVYEVLLRGNEDICENSLPSKQLALVSSPLLLGIDRSTTQACLLSIRSSAKSQILNRKRHNSQSANPSCSRSCEIQTIAAQSRRISDCCIGTMKSEMSDNVTCLLALF